jgi:hypothetical protein
VLERSPAGRFHRSDRCGNVVLVIVRDEYLPQRSSGRAADTKSPDLTLTLSSARMSHAIGGSRPFAAAIRRSR